MTILYFADVRFPIERANGAQTMWTCHALAERGHDVHLVVRPDTAKPPRDAFEFYGLVRRPNLRIEHVRAAGSPLLNRLAFLFAAAGRSIRAFHESVVYTRDLGLASAVLRLPARWRPPVVYESHGFAPEFAGAAGSLLSDAENASRAKRARLERREKQVWRQADAYVTLTERMQAFLTERYAARARVAVIPDGVALPADRRFTPPSIGPRVHVGYAGHLYPWKGVDVLVEALALVPGAHATIVGGHPAEADLGSVQMLARERGIDAKFTGLIEPPRVAAELAVVDVLVLPNRSTFVSATATSPLKLFEYLALGKPIVASALPAIREVLRDGDNAVLVEPDSPAALASGIQRIAQDPSLAEHIARRAFDCAEEYTWARRAERIEDVLRQILEVQLAE